LECRIAPIRLHRRKNDAERVMASEVPWLNTGGEQRIALQIERLTAIGLEDAHVADQHGLLHKRANT
jgi:hypothetical protein